LPELYNVYVVVTGCEKKAAASVFCTGKLMDEIVVSAFNDQGQFDVLGSSLAKHGTSSESVLLWQVAAGLPVEPAATVIATMHRSAVHNGSNVNLINFYFFSYYYGTNVYLISG